MRRIENHRTRILKANNRVNDRYYRLRILEMYDRLSQEDKNWLRDKINNRKLTNYTQH